MRIAYLLALVGLGVLALAVWTSFRSMGWGQQQYPEEHGRATRDDDRAG